MYGHTAGTAKPFRAALPQAASARTRRDHEPRSPRARPAERLCRTATPRSPAGGQEVRPPRHRQKAQEQPDRPVPPSPCQRERHRSVDLEDHGQRGEPRQRDEQRDHDDVGVEDDEAVADRWEQEPPERQSDGAQREHRHSERHHAVERDRRRLGQERGRQIREQGRWRRGEGETGSAGRPRVATMQRRIGRRPVDPQVDREGAQPERAEQSLGRHQDERQEQAPARDPAARVRVEDAVDGVDTGGQVARSTGTGWTSPIDRTRRRPAEYQYRRRDLRVRCHSRTGLVESSHDRNLS